MTKEIVDTVCIVVLVIWCAINSLLIKAMMEVLNRKMDCDE